MCQDLSYNFFKQRETINWNLNCPNLNKLNGDDAKLETPRQKNANSKR